MKYKVQYAEVSMIEDDEDEDIWTREELEALPITALREIAFEASIDVRDRATRAEMVALILGDSEAYIRNEPSPEDLLRESAQLHSWVRGIPPDPDACLKLDDRRWLQRMSSMLFT